MLIFGREEDERVILDFASATDEQLLSLRHRPIAVVVIQARPHCPRIGFDAPRFVAVDREEIHKAKKRNPANA
jgi:hypothetical protein